MRSTRSKLWFALPTLIAFLIAWGAGEIWGALDALRDPAKPETGQVGQTRTSDKSENKSENKSRNKSGNKSGNRSGN